MEHPVRICSGISGLLTSFRRNPAYLYKTARFNENIGYLYKSNLLSELDLSLSFEPTSFRRDPAFLYKTALFDENIGYLYKSNLLSELDLSLSFEPTSFRRDPAFLYKTALFDENIGYLYKSNLLSELDLYNGTSAMIQGVDVHVKEKFWDVCALASTRAGPSGGFRFLPYVSSSTVGQIVQYAGSSGSRSSSLSWSPDATHALALTNPSLGSRGTRDCLVNMLEKNLMSEYFKDAETKVYFLSGGNYTRFGVPGVLDKMVQKVPSTIASRNFVDTLKMKQPKQRLHGSQDTIYALRWYYTPEKGIGFHGIWAGEIQIEKKGSFVRCIQNDLKAKPYESMIPEIQNEVSLLPQRILDEMDRVWSSRPDTYTITEYVARQYVRHAVQGNEGVVDVYDYCTKASKLSNFLDNNKLLEIMDLYDLEWGEYHACEDLKAAINEEAPHLVGVTYTKHDLYGVVPNSFTVHCDYKFSPVRHVNPDLNTYKSFTFGAGDLFEYK